MIFALFLHIKSYEKCAPRIEPAIAPFVEWFKTTTFITSVLVINFISSYSSLLKQFSFADFLQIEDNEQEDALRKEPVISPFGEQLKITSLRRCD